jgi:predicted HicB family RNase H-like nuclease
MKKTNQTGVFLPLSRNEISRIEAVAKRRRETLDSWLLLAITGVLECDEDDAAFEARNAAGGDIMVKIPKKTAARLERAAAFEEMSVTDYVKDGIRRDLALTDEIIAAKN